MVFLINLLAVKLLNILNYKTFDTHIFIPPPMEKCGLKNLKTFVTPGYSIKNILLYLKSQILVFVF